ncbi:MAG: polysaccharide biosynthesis protein [Clostridia bacterium]|nr:polysaccharide biosynthesis protein [Clostridia bacterium]
MKSLCDREEKSASKFFLSVFVLTTSTVIVKIIGMLYKIPMLNILGAEGMGYFNSAYEIYALLCVVVTSGLPIALSILVSANKDSQSSFGIKKIYRSSLFIFLIIGIIGSCGLFFSARWISKFIENENIYFCILTIAPAFFCVCISSAIRGYFQGFSSMLPTAVSQLIEAVSKLVLGLLFALYATDKGFDVTLIAAYAAMGFAVGMLLSTLYLLITKRISDKRNISVRVANENKILKNNVKTNGMLLKIAVPITVSAIIINLTKIIDMTFIMRRLQDLGYTSGVANEMFGMYSTVVIPIFSLVPSLLSPVSLALIPELSSAIEKDDRSLQAYIARTSVRFTAFFAIPATFAIMLYSKPIISILFSSAADKYEYIVPLLTFLASSVLFSCMITTTNAILQSYRNTIKPIISMSVGVLVKIVSEYILIGIPNINIYGAPISTFLCDVVIMVINLYFISRELKGKFYEGSVFLKTMLASIVAMSASLAVYLPLSIKTSNIRLAFIIALPITVIVYFIISFLIKSISVEDVTMLPFGNKIKKYFVREIKVKKEN